MNLASISILIASACFALVGCGESSEVKKSAKPDAQDAQLVGTSSSEEAPGTESTREKLHHYFHRVEQPFDAEWGYEGNTGPSHWGELDASYILAKKGRRQSPIDIEQTVKMELKPLDFDYHLSKIHIVYNGHAIQQNEDSGSFLNVGKRKYRLHQFHFHAPSEHTINGKHFALEMHLVHKDDEGQIAVVALMFEEGDANQWLGPVWEVLPTPENRQRDIDLEFNIGGILPADLSYYEYSGSLTTPPCTEGVQWFIMQTPQSLSASQLMAFTRVIDHNNRPTQPLNGRMVEASE